MPALPRHKFSFGGCLWVAVSIQLQGDPCGILDGVVTQDSCKHSVGKLRNNSNSFGSPRLEESGGKPLGLWALSGFWQHFLAALLSVAEKLALPQVWQKVLLQGKIADSEQALGVGLPHRSVHRARDFPTGRSTATAFRNRSIKTGGLASLPG